MPASPGWPVVLRHEDLVLRPLRRRDESQWDAVRMRNRAWLAPWEATAPPSSRGGPPSYSAMVRWMTREGRAGRSCPWALAVDSGHNRPERCPVVGQVALSGIQYGSARWGSIGYWVDQGHAGRGLVPRGVALACDYAFQVLRLHRIEINIRPENGNSLRVVEKLGFRHEGLRPRYLHIDGQWRDHECFALCAEEIPDGLLARLLGSGDHPTP